SVISLSLFTPDIDLFDMSRVEVLRGPQGTLFGSGTLSGAVRYISNQPKIGADEKVGEFNLSSISNGGIGGGAKAAVNVPISDTAAMRVAAYYTNYGGYMDAVQPNLSVKKDVNSGSRTGARVAFLFKPNAKLSITPRVLYQKVDMDGWNRIDVYNILGNPFTTTRPAVQLGDRRQFTQFKEPFSDKFALGDLNINYDLGGGKTFTSVTSYIDRDIDVLRDATALTASITGGSIGLPANVYSLNAPLDDATKAKGYTQELRVAGGAGKSHWLAGGFYAHNDRTYGQSLDVAGFEALTKIPTKGSFGAGTDILFFSHLKYKFEQFALFGEGTYAVNYRLDLTGGLRYYNFDEKRVQT